MEHNIIGVDNCVQHFSYWSDAGHQSRHAVQYQSRRGLDPRICFVRHALRTAHLRPSEPGNFQEPSHQGREVTKLAETNYRA